jgi:hypothetical protein
LNLGCQATNAALNKKIPEKYVEVINDDPSVNIEESLKASGQKYVCKEFYSGKGSHENRRACFVKAPDESKYKMAGLKLSWLSGAVIEDTGKNLLVVGAIYLQCFIEGCWIDNRITRPL